ELHCGCEQRYGVCNTVLIVEPGRRPKAAIHRLDPVSAGQVLKSAWPIIELHPQRRQPQLPLRLAQTCACFELSLSREPADFLKLIIDLGTSRRAAVA